MKSFSGVICVGSDQGLGLKTKYAVNKSRESESNLIAQGIARRQIVPEATKKTKRLSR